MNVYLIHHTSVLSVEQDPEQHLSEAGRAECARLGGWLKANKVTPARILHSEKQWSLESAERIAEAMGQALMLPPQYETMRAQIERVLPELKLRPVA